MATDWSYRTQLSYFHINLLPRVLKRKEGTCSSFHGTINCLETVVRRHLAETGAVLDSPLSIQYAIEKLRFPPPLNAEIILNWLKCKGVPKHINYFPGNELDEFVPLYRVVEYNTFDDPPSMTGHIVRAMHTYGPIIMEFPVCKNYNDSIGNKVYMADEERSTINGVKYNHCVMATGYGTCEGEPFWEYQNSSGLNFGDNGFGRVSINAIEKAYSIRQFAT